MPTWDDLRYLLAVSRGKTMVAAANEMQTNVATVSRHIQKINERLGYSALQKSNDGWHINERLAGLIEAAEEFDHRLRSVATQPTLDEHGPPVPLRLGCPPLFTTTVILPRLAELRRQMPRVALSVHTRLGGEGLGDYDLVVGHLRPETGRLIQRRLKSPSYGIFQMVGAPESQDWIGLNDIFDDLPAMRMALEHFGRQPVLRFTHYQMIFEAARNTGLPAILPSCCITRAADLALLPGTPAPVENERWLYFHESRKGDALFEGFLRWLVEADRENDALSRAAWDR